jgi:hypothetical protein
MSEILAASAAAHAAALAVKDSGFYLGSGP